MSQITGGKRITTDDFSSEERELVRKLAFILNPFIEQTISIVNGKLTVSDNLNMFFKDVTVVVDANGKTTNTAAFTSSIGKIHGMIVISHQQADSGTPIILSGAPYCTYSQENNIIYIQYVTGLPPDRKINLKLLIL